MDVLCAACDRERNYLGGLIFRGPFREEYLGRAWIWSIPGMRGKWNRSSVLCLIQVSPFFSRFLGTDDGFFIPSWIIGEVDIPAASTVMNDDSVKSDLRRIRSNNLQFEVTRDIASFDDFYHNMYVPYIGGAYGRSAFIIPYEEKKMRFRNCDLLLIKKQDQPIAGMLIKYEKGRAGLWSLGILEGNPEHVRDGVVGALFHYALLYLEEKGFSKAGFGYSRAFLHDGVLKYKKKWGQRIVGVCRDGFVLKILLQTAGVQAFLQHNPFILKKGGLLHAAVFMDKEAPLTTNAFEQIRVDYSYPGLSKLFVYLPYASDTGNRDRVSGGLPENIVLRSYQDLARACKNRKDGK